MSKIDPKIKEKVLALFFGRAYKQKCRGFALEEKAESHKLGRKYYEFIIENTILDSWDTGNHRDEYQHVGISGSFLTFEGKFYLSVLQLQKIIFSKPQESK